MIRLKECVWMECEGQRTLSHAGKSAYLMGKNQLWGEATLNTVLCSTLCDTEKLIVRRSVAFMAWFSLRAEVCDQSSLLFVRKSSSK